MKHAVILFIPIAAVVGLVIGVAGAIFVLQWIGVNLYRMSRLTIGLVFGRIKWAA